MVICDTFRQYSSFPNDTNDKHTYSCCVYDDDNDDGDNNKLHGGRGSPKPFMFKEEWALLFGSRRLHIRVFNEVSVSLKIHHEYSEK